MSEARVEGVPVDLAGARGFLAQARRFAADARVSLDEALTELLEVTARHLGE